MDDLDKGLAFDHDATSLATMATLNLTCAAGDFDIVFSPAATPGGFDELVSASVKVKVGSEDVAVASLEDVLRSKEVVGREKDARAALVIRTYLRDQRA